MDFYLTVGRDGADDYRFIVWKQGNDFGHFVPSKDNFANMWPCPPIVGTDEEALAEAMNATYPRRAPFRLTRRILSPGNYHPRIRRGELIDNHIKYGLSTLGVDEMKLRHTLTSSAAAARILFNKLRTSFEVVELVRCHAGVFGNEFRYLLLLACTETEAAWRSILVANDYPMNKPLTTKDYVQLLKPMQLNDWCVRLVRSHELWELSPFETWDASAPTKSLPWYDGYNATKHDRETNLDRATLENVLNAMSAVFIMLVSQFGADEVSRLGLDDFAVDKCPQTEPLDAYIRSRRTGFGEPVPLWSPVPLFA